jgi:PEP-CTERM motif-containing protein
MRSVSWLRPIFYLSVIVLATASPARGGPIVFGIPVIQYTAVDLADSSTGDLWQYQYDVSGAFFAAFEGFEIHFDQNLYADLSFDAKSPINSDWFPQLLQPDPNLGVFGQGEFDAVALVNRASLFDSFVVNFVYLGPKNTSPGSQSFDLTLFDGTQFDGKDPTTLSFIGYQGSGKTEEVPEPSAIALLGTGLALARLRFKKLSRPS